MITVTITGNLVDEPRTFTTSSTSGCELRIAVDLPSRTPGTDGPVRYFKATAYGVLAGHAADSLRKGDRVTIQGHDLTAETWLNKDGEARAKVAIRVTDIGASLRFDTLTTGRTVRAAARAASRTTDAATQAENSVLDGVTA
jgi:single-strand DNA-binding protein